MTPAAQLDEGRSRPAGAGAASGREGGRPLFSAGVAPLLPPIRAAQTAPALFPMVNKKGQIRRSPRSCRPEIAAYKPNVRVFFDPSGPFQVFFFFAPSQAS